MSFKHNPFVRATLAKYVYLCVISDYAACLKNVVNFLVV